MPRFRLTQLALFCLLVFAGRAAHAATPAPSDRDLRKADAVISKLLRLEETAANSADFDQAVKHFYPALFVAVAALRDGDIKTELATAASLYESARGARNDASAPDCAREPRQSYFSLCRESAGRAQLLRAEAALHTRRAEALLLYARGDRSAATLDTLAELRAERGTDLSLAEEALRALKELDGAESSKNGAESSKQTSEQLSASLEEVDRLLASLPRTRVRQLLAGARDAFRDGLFWQLKSLPSRALVLSADSFAEADPLRPLDLSADDASRAVLQNLRAAHKLIAKAEAAVEDSKRGRPESAGGGQ